MNFFYLLFFPGVILHELSHYFACLLVGVRVFEAKFFGFGTAYVKHARPMLLQSVIITIAPFILCNLIGILAFSEAKLLLSDYFQFSILLYWLGISAVYFSFPSDQDAKNSFHSFVNFFERKILSGGIFSRLCWLVLMPFIFIPIAVILAMIVFFNYLFFLRLLWLLFAFSLGI